MKILNFGSCNIDYVYSIDHIVKVGETETTHKLETFPGGKGLNQSIALARAGAKVYHAGCVGTDGSMLTDILKESGVDVSYMRTVNAKNGHAVIQVSAKGENSIFLYPGSNEMVSEEYVDDILKDFSQGDIILLQNEINNVDYITEQAYSKGMQIVLNPSPFNEKISNIDLNKITYIILNEVEATEYSGFDDPESSLSYFKKYYPSLKVMLTLGEKGCVYMDKGREVRHPIFEVAAVDTTAAGDTFTGYFIEGISQGEAYDNILRIASAASAISISRNGAAPSIPSKDEVLNLITDMKVKKASLSIMNKINTFLDSNLATATLTTLAENLGYSPVYTGSLVKRCTGMSFSAYIQSKRCKAAAHMLINTDLPVSKIINTVGYENENFFRKIFMEKYGKKPLEYRKTVQG